jgi:hypothetical protein
MLIIGCDYHPTVERIAMVDTGTGELTERRLEHENGEAQRGGAATKTGCSRNPFGRLSMGRKSMFMRCLRIGQKKAC